MIYSSSVSLGFSMRVTRLFRTLKLAEIHLHFNSIILSQTPSTFYFTSTMRLIQDLIFSELREFAQINLNYLFRFLDISRILIYILIKVFLPTDFIGHTCFTF